MCIWWSVSLLNRFSVVVVVVHQWKCLMKHNDLYTKCKWLDSNNWYNRTVGRNLIFYHKICVQKLPGQKIPIGQHVCQVSIEIKVQFFLLLLRLLLFDLCCVSKASKGKTIKLLCLSFMRPKKHSNYFITLVALEE